MTITAPLTSTPATPAATLARRLGTTPMPHTTPAGPLWTDGRRVMLAGRVLDHDDLSGLCALLLGQSVPDDHPVFRSQALTPLRDLPRCDLRVLPAESDPDFPDQDGPDDVGLALRVGGTWHLGRVISQASGSCAWHEEVHLGGDWITSVTLYPGYSDQDCRDAVRYNGAHPLARQLFPQQVTRWDDAQRHAECAGLLEATGVFLPLPDGTLHASLVPRGHAAGPALRLIAVTGGAHVSALLPAADAQDLAQAAETLTPWHTPTVHFLPDTGTFRLTAPRTHWTGNPQAPESVHATAALTLPPSAAQGLARLIRQHLPRPKVEQGDDLPF
ncbi:hypothetical protein [Deinococcus enclensis]|uniref:Uncharacterized protein n=1 Tax=Deinococcus enclensis TaxID=1049582 RepID=A0ABT9MF70_9DEIO|nr:hypothetical protein [Deinococcus enclensis]MDP9765240.1 hypothetical protein [Deinococcus enclensis]